ncbi:MAG: histidyl-tRNA synthetase [Acidobacteria bacterium OLB17]|nr:MAG: histidyl-tRNA synthetase [Acidobacteria bacterium OLB17]MCZ2390150.1 histidine--tRNA ligase [Acidobacteriota bacterium]
MASTNPARGTRDFLPADIRKREYVIGIIKEVYESYGFEPLETPAFENLETLTGKYGEEGGQLMFKILKRGEKLDIANAKKVADLADLALRYDLTVPLARVVADKRDKLPKFFKRYQIQPVWRADRPARGRYREFYQCDVDSIGSTSPLVEAELISAAAEIFERLGFTDYVFRLNDRKRLSKMVSDAGIEASLETDAMVALDKLDKIGEEGVLNELQARGISREAAGRFLSFAKDPEAAPQSETIAKVVSLLRSSDRIKDDPSLARGLSYYTGMIIEVNVPDLPGSLAGGGRYDGLIGMFGKEQIPACGISLGLERILVVMDERGMFPPEVADSTPADVMVTVLDEETAAETIKLAAELRAAGLRVTVYPDADKLGKQLKYADSLKVPYVCVLGESELAEGKVTLKDLRTGEQESLERENAIKKLGAAIRWKA